jgi:hypothetical protein
MLSSVQIESDLNAEGVKDQKRHEERESFVNHLFFKLNIQ